MRIRLSDPARFRGRLTRLAVLLLALTSACSTGSHPAPSTLAQVGAARHAESPNYALLIDASSSGSRIHIFEWLPGEANGLPRVEAAPAVREAGEEAWQLVVDGGLSDYAAEPELAGESLAPLLEFAQRKLAEAGAAPAAASLHLKATAGLRLVSEPARSEIMDDVRATLEASSFDFRTAEIISGQQEGVYGWISVNYLLGQLGGGRFPTVGALDLGGASTQITFVPIDFPESEGAVLELGGTTYRVYSHSYLGFGQDQARQAVASPACFPRGYPMAPTGEVGSGDFAACRAAIREFLERPCAEGDCSLMGVYQPPLYGDFFAFSGYGYISSFLGLDQNLSLPDLERRATAYCESDWQQVLTDYPGEGLRKYLPTYCFNAVYVATLLTDGFGFAPDTRRVATPRQVQGSEVSWVLGSLLYELGASAD